MVRLDQMIDANEAVTSQPNNGIAYIMFQILIQTINANNYSKNTNQCAMSIA